MLRITMRRKKERECNELYGRRICCDSIEFNSWWWIFQICMHDNKWQYSVYSRDIVDVRPEYPAEETEKAEIVEEYENVTSDCDDASLMVCFSLIYCFYETLLKVHNVYSITMAYKKFCFHLVHHILSFYRRDVL